MPIQKDLFLKIEKYEVPVTVFLHRQLLSLSCVTHITSRHRGTLFIDLLPLSFSATFLIQPRPTSSGITLFMVAWALLYQLVIKKCCTHMHVGQSDRENSSAEIPCFPK